MILDGRHKHRAAIIAGITPTFKQFVGRDAVAYVTKKLFRQHLDTSQRAMMAATLTKLSPLPGVQNCTSPTLAEAAETMNVSRRTVASAAKVQATGTAELNDAVRDGTLTVGDAAAVADEPAEVQNQAVEAVRSGQAGTAAEAAGVNNDNRPKGRQSDAVLCDKCMRVRPVKDCRFCAAAQADARRTAHGQLSEVTEPDNRPENEARKTLTSIAKDPWDEAIKKAKSAAAAVRIIGKTFAKPADGKFQKDALDKIKEVEAAILEWKANSVKQTRMEF